MLWPLACIQSLSTAFTLYADFKSRWIGETKLEWNFTLFRLLETYHNPTIYSIFHISPTTITTDLWKVNKGREARSPHIYSRSLFHRLTQTGSASNIHKGVFWDWPWTAKVLNEYCRSLQSICGCRRSWAILNSGQFLFFRYKNFDDIKFASALINVPNTTSSDCLIHWGSGPGKQPVTANNRICSLLLMI